MQYSSLVKALQNICQWCKILSKLTCPYGLNFHLDAKNEEKVKKGLKISLALPLNLLANGSGRVEFYTLVCQ